MLKVFTATQDSYTAWFLEAFNKVLELKLDILSLSTGGIDYLDYPFVEKIKEIVNSGTIVISAAGNDGPGLGTLNNPGDMIEIISVGALGPDLNSAAIFSSRGPTL